MSPLRNIVVRLVNLFRRDRLERELDAELRAYLELDVEENIRRGMAPKEAAAARRRRRRVGRRPRKSGVVGARQVAGRRDARAGSHAGCRPGGHALPAVSARECRSFLCAHAALGGVHSPRRVEGPCPVRSRRRPRGRPAPAVGLLGQRRASGARARGRRPAGGRHPTGGRSQSMAGHSSVARRGHPAHGRRGRPRVALDRVGRTAARRDPSAGGAGRHRSAPGARLARLRSHGDRRPRVDPGLVARTGIADLVGPLHRRDAQDRLARLRGRRRHDVAEAADCRPGRDGGVAAGGRRPRVAQPSRRDAGRPRLRDARRGGRECRPGAGRPRPGRGVSLPVARGHRRRGASRGRPWRRSWSASCSAWSSRSGRPAS